MVPARVICADLTGDWLDRFKAGLQGEPFEISLLEGPEDMERSLAALAPALAVLHGARWPAVAPWVARARAMGGPRLKILVLLPEVSPAEVLEAWEVGADDLLQDTLTLATLKTRIRVWVARSLGGR